MLKNVAKHIVSLDQVEDGGKKTKIVKSTKDPPTIEVNQTWNKEFASERRAPTTLVKVFPSSWNHFWL